MQRTTPCLPKQRAKSSFALGAIPIPIVASIPVLLRDDIEPTIKLAQASLSRARALPGSVDERCPDLFLESVGVSEAEKNLIATLADAPATTVDPVVSVMLAATNGNLYKHLIGRLTTYPIPRLPLPHGEGKLLLDIGCGWGRWSIAAARNGYKVVGVDSSLGALLAAQRVAKSMNVDITFVCADSRHLPFQDSSFDQVYSYSVLQHFSRPNALAAFAEIGRTLHPGGRALIQMANYFGIRNLYNLARRGFSDGAGFDVRYWKPGELNAAFARSIGPSELIVHCYFGLGLETTDADLIPWRSKLLIRASERLRQLSRAIPPLRYIADSVYVDSFKPGHD